MIRSFFASMNIPERVLFSIYTLFSLWLILSLVGFFNGWSVVLVTIVIVWLTVHNISSHRSLRIESDIQNIRWVLWLGVPVLMIGWMLLRGFYTGDAYAFWLPWARDIALSGSMPNWITHTRIPYTSAGPFLPIVLASLFTLLPISQFSVMMVPVIFFILALTVMVHWMQEKYIPVKWILIGIVLVLFNAQTVFWSWNLLTESMLLLGFTLFFYFFEKIWSITLVTTQRELQRWWLFLIASFCFAVLVKFSSILLGILLLLLLIKKKSRPSLRMIPLLALVSIPLLIWLIRNYVIYDSPIYPLLNGLFGGEYSKLYQLTDPFKFWLVRYPTLWSRASYILSEFIVIYPIMAFATIGMWKSKFRVPHLFAIGIAIISGIVLIFSASSGMRYLWPYITLMAVYAVIALRETQSRILKTGMTLIAMYATLQVLPIESTSSFISSIEQLAQPLKMVAQALHTYWWVTLLVFVPIVYKLTRTTIGWQSASIMLLATGILHTRWIENKSFITTWAFIIAILSIIVVSMAVKKLAYSKRLSVWVSVVVVGAMYFTNSYGQAGIYYMRHDLVWPHTYVNEKSVVLSELLNKQGIPQSQPLITLNGTSFFQWFDVRTVYQFNSFEFIRLTDTFYTEDTSAEDLYALLSKAGIPIVVQVSSSHNEPLYEHAETLLNDNPDLFDRICDTTITDVCIWRLVKDKS